MKNALIIAALLVFIIGCDSGKTVNADIQLVTVQCGTCKKTIEKGVSDVKGVVKVEVDVEKKIGHVTYKAGVVDLAIIEKAISALGYDANNTTADPTAYETLPGCCKMSVSH
jgi:copper chaperone CopZ